MIRKRNRQEGMMDDAELFRTWIETNPPDPRDKEQSGKQTGRPSRPGAHTRLDLHGQTVAASEDLVRRFIRRAKAAGTRQVIIITGKGMHSGRAGGVLKDHVASFLDSGRAGVIRGWRRGNPHEGGEGSIIVDI